jgi:hypothetical protein
MYLPRLPLFGKPPWRKRSILFILLAIPVTLYLFLGSSIIFSTTVVQFEPSIPAGRTAPVHKQQHAVLLVSAYFPLSKSKHSNNEYKLWLTNFLGTVTTDIYFYTTPDMEPIVRQARRDLPITINTSFLSPFDIPPLAGMNETYQLQKKKDRERNIHSPKLYAIWNSKPYFLDEALKTSNKKYDFAFWTDAGSFRDRHIYTSWPDYGRLEETWNAISGTSGRRKEDLIFFPMWWVPHVTMRFWYEGMGPIDNEFSEGQ